MADRQTKVILSATATEYIDAFDKATKKTRELGSEAEKLAQKTEAFNRLGTGALLAGGAITAATALSVKAAIDWESAWAGVTKTVDGTDAEMAELEDQLRSLTGVLPATHEEIAGVAEAAGQLGVAREDVAGFTKTMIDLAETTNLTADEAATSIAQLMNVMQTAPDDVDNLGAALVALGNDGASTERDIVQMAQRIAGAGQIVGLTEAEVLGFANALASVGIEAEAGGTAISRIMTDIAMSVSAGGDELEQFAEVAGLSSADFQKAFKDDPADAIATFIEGLADIDAAGGDVFKTLDDLGQSDIRVSQALLGMANSGDLLRESLELGGQAWEDNLALIEEARKRYQTTEAQIQIAQNSIRDAAIDMGSVFLPAIKEGADAVAGLAQGFTDLPEPVQGLVGLLGGVAGAVALTGGAALLAVPKIAEYKAAMATLNTTTSRMAFIGGGATVALTALIAVVGTLAQKQAQARQRAEGYAQALDAGAEAARDFAVDNLTLEKSIVGLNFGSAFDNAEKLGISLELVTEAVSGNKDALLELNDVLDTATGGGSAAQEMADKLGISYLDLAQSAGTLKEAVQEETDGLAQGKRIREQSKKAIDENADSTNTAAEAYQAAADNASDLNDELSKLMETIDKANQVGQDAVTQNLDYQDALREVDEQIRNIRDGVEGYAGGLDETTQAGSDNMRMLVDLAREAKEAADAQFALDGDTEKYRQTLESSRQTLLDRADDLGAAAGEAENLADQIFQIPSDTEWEFIADTADGAFRIQRLQEAINNLRDKTIRITVTRPDGAPLTDEQIANQIGIGRAGGGPVLGAGSSISDSILTPLSDGEHIWSASEVKAAGGHANVAAFRKWVSTGQGFPFAMAPDGSTRPIEITNNISAQPGMSVEQIGNISAEKTEFVLRGK